jgi:copper chaperone CopZ
MKRIFVIIIAAMAAFSAEAAQSNASDPQAQEATITPRNKRHALKKQKDIREVTFRVHLHCANCVKKVEENIAFEKGVKGLDVCLGHQTVNVKYDPAKTSEETLKASIEKLGYEVSGVVAPEEVHHHDH